MQGEWGQALFRNPARQKPPQKRFSHTPFVRQRCRRLTSFPACTRRQWLRRTRGVALSATTISSSQGGGRSFSRPGASDPPLRAVVCCCWIPLPPPECKEGRASPPVSPCQENASLHQQPLRPGCGWVVEQPPAPPLSLSSLHCGSVLARSPSYTPIFLPCFLLYSDPSSYTLLLCIYGGLGLPGKIKI